MAGLFERDPEEEKKAREKAEKKETLFCVLSLIARYSTLVVLFVVGCIDYIPISILDTTPASIFVKIWTLAACIASWCLASSVRNPFEKHCFANKLCKYYKVEMIVITCIIGSIWAFELYAKSLANRIIAADSARAAQMEYTETVDSQQTDYADILL